MSASECTNAIRPFSEKALGAVLEVAEKPEPEFHPLFLCLLELERAKKLQVERPRRN